MIAAMRVITADDQILLEIDFDFHVNMPTLRSHPVCLTPEFSCVAGLPACPKHGAFNILHLFSQGRNCKRDMLATAPCQLASFALLIAS